MLGDVKKFVVECEVCQRMKYEVMSPTRLLQSLPIPAQICEDLLMNFITRLPKIRVDTILVIVDRLTKYGHFLPLKHLYTVKEVVEISIKEVV